MILSRIVTSSTPLKLPGSTTKSVLRSRQWRRCGSGTGWRGSGKTSVLVPARAGWLLRRQEAHPEQILLLAFGRQAADEMNTRIKDRLHTDGIKAKTFHALALQIIQEGSKKAPKISKLETDASARAAACSSKPGNNSVPRKKCRPAAGVSG